MKDDTQTEKGTTGAPTNAQAKNYEGFTAPQTIEQKTIAGDGSTIVNVYYKRNVYSVKFMGYGDSYVCGKEEHTHSRRTCGGNSFSGWKCGKEAHKHNDNCKYGELTDKTITAKWGANISAQWPTYQGSSTWAVNPTGGPYQANIDTMPMGGAKFYQYRPSYGAQKQTASYYVEVVQGETGTENVGGTSYKLDHEDTTYYNGWLSVTEEDQYAITGFTFNEKVSTSVGNYYHGAKFYYTRNSYDITFINGGKTEKTESRKYQQDISDVTYTPTRPAGVPANFTFAGWYDNKLCKGDPFVFTGKTMPAKGITLYAKWQAPQVNATVYLSASADSKPETFSVPYGKKITESEEFNAIIARIKEETGEAPSAWFVVTGEGRVLFDLDTPLYSSVTLYPFFASSSEGYTVTYKEEGTDEPAKDEQKYLTGSRAGILAPVNGENFLAWETEDNKLIYPGDKITVTKNTTLTAVYTNKPQTVTIKYHYNFTDKDGNYNDAIFEDGNHPKNTKAEVLTLSAAGFELVAGYEFLGWALTANGSITYQPGGEAFVDGNGDNDLWAVWSRKLYTIKWLDEDGSVLDTEEYEYNAVPSYKKGTPTKASTEDTVYTFDGWNPEIVPVTESTEYTATYKDSARKYTVKWLDEDGSLLREDTVEYGTMPNYGANPTKAADAQYTYTFKDWTPEVETVTGDATYQATYTKEANSYTLTYNLDGGEWENDTTYTYTKKYNEEVEVKADPTKEGYTFVSWMSEEVEVVNGKFTMPAKNVTLKAKWEANIYKVTYDLDGGEWTEATNEFPYEYKATVEVVKTIPTREGYKFSGWRSEEVTIENDAFTMPAQDVVLKAVWEANPTPTPIPSEEPTPTPAPTEEPTPTPAPTEEPTPTPAPTEEPTPTPAPTEESTPTPAPNPNPNPNPNPATPTPAPVAPVVPATVATPTPTPTATPSTTPSDNGGKGDGNNDGEIGETINDNDTPLTNGEDIADNATPLAGLGTGAWALINLILTIVTTLLSILLLIGYIGKKKKALEDEDGNVVLDENGKEVMEYEKNKKGLWRLISIIPALIAIIVFIFTEDMTLPMIFVDKWTILHVVIALVQVVVMVLCKKKKDENDEDENAANA